MSDLTGSHLIARALKIEGIQNVFTLAGDHVLPLLDVMSDGDFRFIDTRHEQAAVHMADAWGRITGQPGVSIYTTPGLANAVPGLAAALHSESPVLSISGSAALSELGRGAMQEIDQIGMVRPVTKGAWMVTDPRRIPDMIAHALRVAYDGRRGPVHLTVPIDVQQQRVTPGSVMFYEPGEYRGIAPASTAVDQIRRTIELLKGAERPVIVAGSAATYSRSGAALQRFIETARVPLLTEGDARGLVSDEHPYCFGFFDSGLNPAARLVGEADVVVLLGRKQDLVAGYAMPPTIGADARVVQIDPSAIEIGRNRGVAAGLSGDIDTILEQLTEEAADHKWSDLPWLERLRAEQDSGIDRMEKLAASDVPMHAMDVHKALGELVRPDDFVIFDGGDFCHFGRAYLPARGPMSWLYFSTFGMLGTSIPSAMAAKLAHPDRRVFVLTGDGAFGFNAMEFDTAVRHDLPFVAILGNDSAWGIDRQIQLGVYGRQVATDLLPSGYHQVVQGLGGHAEQVDRPEDVTPAIERAIDSGRPSLLNVRVQGAISPRAEAAIARWTGHGDLPF